VPRLFSSADSSFAVNSLQIASVKDQLGDFGAGVPQGEAEIGKAVNANPNSAIARYNG
jgi:hypothetical protein